MKSQTPSSKKPRQLLNVTLAGLPELEHFEDGAQREKALTEIGEEAADLKSGGYWLAIVLLIGATLTARFVAWWLLRLVVWPALLEDALLWLFTLGVAVLTLRALHRWGTAGQLRTKLLASGVPVCMKCGYLLRGLPLDPGRCPECGRPFDESVRAILRGVAPSQKSASG